MYSYGRNPTLHFSYGLVTVNGCIKAQGYNPRRKLAARERERRGLALPVTLYRKGTTPAENWRRGNVSGAAGLFVQKEKAGFFPALSFAMRFYSVSGLSPIFSAFACTFFMAFCTA